ncbi:MAG: amidohydrolase family protein [Chloroflexi bacterium]|nr:amidohydrolase family protein [Chloroflexota bacterium]
MTHHYTVLFGGTVLTLDGALPTDAATRASGSAAPDAAGRRATAICYAHERILAIGGDAEVLALAGPDSMVVDLRRRAVVPGFVEPHAHPYWEGVVAGMALLGVLLAHVSGHAVAVNSLALALAGIDGATPSVPGRLEIERDAAGEPTGILRGPDAWDRMAAAMPALTTAEGVAALARATARLAADGVTSVADADVGSTAGVAAELAAWGEAIASGAMPLGVSLLPGLARIAAAPDDPVPSPRDIGALLAEPARARARLTHVKLKADGALTTRTAWLREAYADAPHAGGPVHEPAVLAERVRRAAAAGWGAATHAIGDAGIVAVLDAYAAAPAPAGIAHRVDHAMLLDEALVARLAASGATAVVQPEFLAWAGATYRARLGDERAGRLLPFAALLAAGVPMAFSSDRPVIPGAPLDGIRAAVRHDHALSVAEAIHAWTAAAAAALGDDDAGCLTVGARTDLAILSGDPTAVPADAWGCGDDGIRVEATVAAGRLVHGTLEGAG